MARIIQQLTGRTLKRRWSIDFIYSRMAAHSRPFWIVNILDDGT